MVLRLIRESSLMLGALGTTKFKIELYKGVIATINVHLSEK